MTMPRAPLRPLPAALALALLAVLLAPAAQAWTGTAGGYRGRDPATDVVFGSGDWTNNPTGAWADINLACGGCGVVAPAIPSSYGGGAAWSGSIPLGFSFDFAGTARTNIQAHGYGALGWGGSFSNILRPLADASTPNNIIAGVLDASMNAGCYDMGGQVYYRSYPESAPGANDRVFVYQFNNINMYNGGACGQDAPGRNTYQVRLYQGSNVIEVHYQSVSNQDPYGGSDRYSGIKGTTALNYPPNECDGCGALRTLVNQAVQYRPAGVTPTITPDTYTFDCGGICPTFTVAGATAGTPKLTANDRSVASAPYDAIYDSGLAAGATLQAVSGGACTGTSPAISKDGSFCFTPPATANPCEGSPFTFTYKDVDAWGASAPATVTINLAGCNQPPSVADYEYDGYEDVTLVVGAPGLADPLYSIDPEGTAVLVDPTCVGYTGLGTLDVKADGSFTFKPPLDFTGDDQFTFCLIDGDGVRSAMANVLMHIIPNDDPHAAFYVSDPEPDAGVAVTFTDDSSDRDGLRAWHWDFGDARTSTARNPTHVYTWPGQYYVRLTVTDIYGATSSRVRLIDVRFPADGSFESGDAMAIPVAFAGPDRVAAPGSTVVLTGRHEGDPGVYTYQWRQVPEATVVLANATRPMADFVAPSVRDGDVRLTFELIVATGDVSSRPDRVEVLVRAANRAPDAVAGLTIQALPGDEVRLDASNSGDDDGDALAYKWSQVSGARMALAGAESEVATFTVPAGTPPGTLLFRLEASDGIATAADSVQVVIMPVDVVREPLARSAGQRDDGAGAQATPGVGPLLALALLGLALAARRRRAA